MSVSHSFVLGTLLPGLQDTLPGSPDGQGIDGYTNEWGQQDKSRSHVGLAESLMHHPGNQSRKPGS
jgi:hypothetical protein